MGTADNRQINPNQSLVLFDGVCHFCNNSVNFVIDRDPKHKFVFAPLQSQLAADMLRHFGEDSIGIDTIILIQNNKLYKRTRASLEIAKQLNGLWPMFYGFIIVPGFIRDLAYKLFARYRYRWFGKMDACRMPTAEMRERFVG